MIDTTKKVNFKDCVSSESLDIWFRLDVIVMVVFLCLYFTSKISKTCLIASCGSCGFIGGILSALNCYCNNRKLEEKESGNDSEKPDALKKDNQADDYEIELHYDASKLM